jgi:hypothetical protein
MQMPGAGIDQPADITIGTHHPMHIPLFDQLEWVRISLVRQGLVFRLQVLEMTRGVGQLAVAPAQVALDAVVLDALANNIDRIQPQLLKHLDAFTADVFFMGIEKYIGREGIETLANPANQLAAVAARGAPGNLMRFEHDHGKTALSQFDGGVQSGKARADDAHVKLDRTLQGRAVESTVSRGVVVRLRCR